MEVLLDGLVHARPMSAFAQDPFGFKQGLEYMMGTRFGYPERFLDFGDVQMFFPEQRKQLFLPRRQRQRFPLTSRLKPQDALPGVFHRRPQRAAAKFDPAR